MVFIIVRENESYWVRRRKIGMSYNKCLNVKMNFNCPYVIFHGLYMCLI